MEHKQIAVRVNQEELSILLNACKLQGLSISSFLRSVGLERGREVLIKNGVIKT